MNEFLKKTLDSWKGIHRSQQILIIAVAVLAIVVIAVIVSMYTQEEYEVLYANLSQEEAAQVYAALEEQGVDAEATGDGTTILVPKGQAQNLRMTLAAEGLPASNAVDYTFYTENGTAFGNTDRDKQRVYTYQLQMNLANTINQMAKIKSSIVLLNIKEESNFVLSNNDSSVSSASVQIQPEFNATITETDAMTIRELVAAAVPSLSPNDVVIVNGETMQTYPVEGELGSGSNAVTERVELQNSISLQLRQQILTLLSPVFGPNDVSASVNVELDFDDYSQESLTLSPPTDVGSEENMGIITSLKDMEERVLGAAAAEGEPGMDTNGGAPVYQELTEEELQNSVYYQVTHEVNAEVNEVIERLQRAKGSIKDISATLIVNGGEEMQDMLPEIRSMVSTAIGIPEDRITVSAMPFEYQQRMQEDIEAAEAEEQERARQQQIQDIIKIAIIVGAIVAVIFLILNNNRKKKEADLDRERLAFLEQQEAEREALLAEQAGQMVDVAADEALDIEALAEEQEHTTLASIKSLIDKNPEGVASILRNWLLDDYRR